MLFQIEVSRRVGHRPDPWAFVLVFESEQCNVVAMLFQFAGERIEGALFRLAASRTSKSVDFNQTLVDVGIIQDELSESVRGELLDVCGLLLLLGDGDRSELVVNEVI